MQTVLVQLESVLVQGLAGACSSSGQVRSGRATPSPTTVSTCPRKRKTYERRQRTLARAPEEPPRSTIHQGNRDERARRARPGSGGDRSRPRAALDRRAGGGHTVRGAGLERRDAIRRGPRLALDPPRVRGLPQPRGMGDALASARPGPRSDPGCGPVRCRDRGPVRLHGALAARLRQRRRVPRGRGQATPARVPDRHEDRVPHRDEEEVVSRQGPEEGAREVAQLSG